MISRVVCFFIVIAGALPVSAQVVLRHKQLSATIEAFGNVTMGIASNNSDDLGTRDGDLRLDVAVRLLGRIEVAGGPDFGARIVAQRSPEGGTTIGEASLLLLGRGGRLEVGERMGLPDVLSGYAPNNFTFTGAEFGPASGPSLDPSGGLQTAFFDRSLAARINSLTALGVASALFDDQSVKVLYVSPKHRGFLGGISFAPNADDPRYRDLVQIGLTHERYWSQNVWRWGGSYTFAQGAHTQAGIFDNLNSLNLGVTTTLSDSLMLGASATLNSNSGLPRSASGASPTAWGITTSVNYNTGPWTLGAYYQFARAAINTPVRADARLATVEAGLSYRFNTRMRLYGAWFHYDFSGAYDRAVSASIHEGDALVAGVRLIL